MILHSFISTKINGMDGHEFMYRNPIHSLDLHYIQNPTYKLGFVTVYDIRLAHSHGIGIGYGFTYGNSVVRSNHNYVLYMRPKLAKSDIISVAKKGGSLELKYSLTNIKIFVYPNLVLVTRSEVDETIIRSLNND